LTSKIKESIFSVFGETKLPPISTNASSAAINRWKKSPEVWECYRKLYRPISGFDNDSATYLERIVERVFPDMEGITDVQIAYATSVCDFFLNPENESIHVTELTIKDKFQKSLVSLAIM